MCHEIHLFEKNDFSFLCTSHDSASKAICTMEENGGGDKREKSICSFREELLGNITSLPPKEKIGLIKS